MKDISSNIENTYTERYVTLPNFILRDKKIYFNLHDNIYIKDYKYYDTYESKQLYLGDVGYEGDLNILGNKIYCNINDIEYEKGLRVKIKYLKNSKIKDHQIAKITKAIEATLLDIDIFDEEYTDEKLFYEDINPKKIKDYDSLLDDGAW